MIEEDIGTDAFASGGVKKNALQMECFAPSINSGLSMRFYALFTLNPELVEGVEGYNAKK